MKRYWPRLLSVTLVLSFAFAILGADSPSVPTAVLRTSGQVRVNDVASQAVTTLFPGDSVQTDRNSAANMISGGSSVLVAPSASVIFIANNMVELTEGGITIATSAGMSARVDGLTITPTIEKQSKFEVAENEDSVVVAALQGNVTVSDGKQTSTVQEGQETTRDKKTKQEIPPAAKGGIEVSKKTKKTLAVVGAAGGAAALTALAMEMSEPGKKCISSAGDKRCKCKIDSSGKADCRQDY